MIKAQYIFATKYNKVAHNHVTKYGTCAYQLIFIMRSYFAQLITSDSITLRRTRLKPPKSASLLPSLNLIFLNLVIS